MVVSMDAASMYDGATIGQIDAEISRSKNYLENLEREIPAPVLERLEREFQAKLARGHWKKAALRSQY